MKKLLLLASFATLVLLSCNETDRNLDGSSSENGEDAARNFIRAALDGDYEKARTYLLNDSMNQEDLNVSARYYKERMNAADKEKYRGASIIIHEVKNVDSATSIVYFSNSFRKQKDSLKVTKVDQKWLVDFKYIFKHKPDSTLMDQPSLPESTLPEENTNNPKQN